VAFGGGQKDSSGFMWRPAPMRPATVPRQTPCSNADVFVEPVVLSRQALIRLLPVQIDFSFSRLGGR
jgi:hypothetical protein